MINKIAILDTGYVSYSQEQAILSGAGYDLQIFRGDKADAMAKREFAMDAKGIFIRWTQIDSDFLAKCKHLKVIVRYGTGYDNIDLDAASAAGVKVCNVNHYADHSVSDHALALIYACSRGLFPAVATFKDNFGRPPFERIFELHRKTLGIIGLGRIGGTLAGKAGGLFKTVLASDPYITDRRFEDLGVNKTGLDELLDRCDVITIHCNLTAETRHMINNATFNKMTKIPIIINTSRGPVIKTEDLTSALEENKILAAGIDVFDSELPGEIPAALLDNPRIVSTGHYAWYSENSIAELQRRAAENMLALLSGRSTEDSLN